MTLTLGISALKRRGTLTRLLLEKKIIFFCSAQWDESFTQIKLNLLPRLGSDNNPIILDRGELNLKKSYFKFEQQWMVLLIRSKNGGVFQCEWHRIVHFGL